MNIRTQNLYDGHGRKIGDITFILQETRNVVEASLDMLHRLGHVVFVRYKHDCNFVARDVHFSHGTSAKIPPLDRVGEKYVNSKCRSLLCCVRSIALKSKILHDLGAISQLSVVPQGLHNFQSQTCTRRGKEWNQRKFAKKIKIDGK